jgi:hypothetical protein
MTKNQAVKTWESGDKSLRINLDRDESHFTAPRFGCSFLGRIWILLFIIIIIIIRIIVYGICFYNLVGPIAFRTI